MQLVFFIVFLFTFSFSNNKFCDLSIIQEEHINNSLRSLYNIGEIISDEDRLYAYNVCHSDNNIDINEEFQLNDYAGNIILISMNATW